MAIEYFTDLLGNERIRKTTNEEITLFGKNYKINFDVLKSNFTVGDTTDEVAAENNLDDAIYQLIHTSLHNSYYIPEEYFFKVCTWLEEITE